ncbi:MAG: hypothetical protein KIS79_05185 [Burkholderiales bacterium]|nr:hypothetical protein [Burkholderiales bacterium]
MSAPRATTAAFGAFALFALFALFASTVRAQDDAQGEQAFEPVLASAEFTGRWVRPNEPLAIRLHQPPRGDLRVFVGTLDVSVFVRRPAPAELVIEPLLVPLPAGESVVTIYAIEESGWKTITQLPLRVLTQHGFESASAEPRLDLNLKSRAAEGRSDDAPRSQRGTYADLAGQGAFGAQFRRNEHEVALVINAVGSSYQGEALRVGELGDDAPRVDLADYRVDWRRRGLGISAGHLSHGNHPLLLNGFLSRGVSATVPLVKGLDVSLAALNGTAIVGTDNLLGLSEPEHRVYGVTLGKEVLPEHYGNLRVELSYMYATVQARTAFNAGEVPDAERSDGFGIRLIGRNASGRLRVDAALARSTYTNPADVQLEQSGEIKRVQPETRMGHSLDLAYDLLQGSTLLSDRHPLQLTLQWQHERIEPLYRSLGASLATDVLSDRFGVVAAVAGAQLSLQHFRREDNLDDIPTLLTTGDRSWEASLALPLSTWLGGGAPTSAWPALTLGYRHMRQSALNAPPTDASGFAATHLPDQANTSYDAGASWAGSTWGASYAIAYALQDNRQVGRQRADVSSLSHQISLSRRIGTALGVNGAIGLMRQYNRESSLTQRNAAVTLGADWQLGEYWSITGSVSAQRGRDSEDSQRNDGWGLQAQAARQIRIKLPFAVAPLPAQLFIRYSDITNKDRNSIFDFASDIRQWGVDLGLSISAF